MTSIGFLVARFANFRSMARGSDNWFGVVALVVDKGGDGVCACAAVGADDDGLDMSNDVEKECGGSAVYALIVCTALDCEIAQSEKNERKVSRDTFVTGPSLECAAIYKEGDQSERVARQLPSSQA